jgi:hypothetical protein
MNRGVRGTTEKGGPILVGPPLSFRLCRPPADSDVPAVRPGRRDRR